MYQIFAEFTIYYCKNLFPPPGIPVKSKNSQAHINRPTPHYMDFTTQTHTRLGPDDDDNGNSRRNTDIKNAYYK